MSEDEWIQGYLDAQRTPKKNTTPPSESWEQLVARARSEMLRPLRHRHAPGAAKRKIRGVKRILEMTDQ